MTHKIYNGEGSKYLWIIKKNVVDNLWYITGDEGCCQVSSELRVYFLRRKQMHILGGNPPPANLHRPYYFNGVKKLWYIMGDEGCGEVSLK